MPIGVLQMFSIELPAVVDSSNCIMCGGGQERPPRVRIDPVDEADFDQPASDCPDSLGGSSAVPSVMARGSVHHCSPWQVVRTPFGQGESMREGKMFAWSKLAVEIDHAAIR